MRFALIAVLAATRIVSAAPALSLIQDILYKADGTRFEGTAQISWKSFRAADGTEIPQQTTTIKIFMGQLRVQLVPTTNAAEPTTYTVKFNSDGKTQFVEYWSVPPSTGRLRLKDVRGNPVAGPITDGTVEISDVTGLRNELDVRPTRGSGFIPSRAAIINASGSIDGAIGNPAHCLRVDGTSGPCGDSSSILFIDGETPSGVIDGSNRIFTLAGLPATPASLHLFRNGILLKQGAGYTLAGTLITMDETQTPEPGDTLDAYYRLPSTTDTTQFIESETPFGGVDGANAHYTLSAAPLPSTSLQMFRNGILQKAGLDFLLDGNVVTFLPEAIPQPGDVLQATYRR